MATATPSREASQRTYKFVLMGDGSSGKTSIVSRYAQESFGKQYQQTVGLDWFSKRIDLPGNGTATLQLWDIGGQSLTGKMIKNYIEGADAIVFVYDLTNKSSFDNLLDWMDLVKNYFAPPAKMPRFALVGNKRDMSHLRVVSIDAHVAFAKLHGMSSHVLSAKTGDGVSIMFRTIVGDLSGVPMTKAEADTLNSRVMTAEVVTHADATPKPVKQSTFSKRRNKSAVCSLQ
eukprot:m.59095 g.59095  ORF g.59095 m.59095 type:complete len:231 (-) comp15674_c0_seq4:232-924(-)